MSPWFPWVLSSLWLRPKNGKKETDPREPDDQQFLGRQRTHTPVKIGKGNTFKKMVVTDGRIFNPWL